MEKSSLPINTIATQKVYRMNMGYVSLNYIDMGYVTLNYIDMGYVIHVWVK